MVGTLAATGSHARVYIVNGAQGDGIRLPELGNKKRKRKADLGIGEEVRLIQVGMSASPGTWQYQSCLTLIS